MRASVRAGRTFWCAYLLTKVLENVGLGTRVRYNKATLIFPPRAFRRVSWAPFCSNKRKKH